LQFRLQPNFLLAAFEAIMFCAGGKGQAARLRSSRLLRLNSGVGCVIVLREDLCDHVDPYCRFAIGGPIDAFVILA
jgi:hypothetical protein